MENQRHLFSLPENVHYLNCATMSPLSKKVEEVGIAGLRLKAQPYNILQNHFFETADILKEKFSQLINCPDPERIAIMSSVSYGMATVVKTLLKKGIPPGKTRIVVVGSEFPSDVYAWEELSKERRVLVDTIAAPPGLHNRGKDWNNALLNSINSQTLLVCISPTHWADGTSFNLKAIRKACTESGALLVIDGTQHVGASPFDVQDIMPDFMIVAAYKWLLGPYSSALAYCSEYFDDGAALEQTWIARIGSNEFKNLINYQSELRPKAFRYNMGEFSNFINLPMMVAGIDQLLETTPATVMQYAKHLGKEMTAPLKNEGYWIEDEQFRSSHLFGVQAPDHVNMNSLKQELLDKNIYVSYRGSAIRVSINTWNTDQDIQLFKDVLLKYAQQ